MNDLLERKEVRRLEGLCWVAQMTSATDSGKRPRKITELDGLRGLMALIVVCSHLYSHCGFTTDSLWRPLQFLTYGPMAVDVFIILSGFVIFLLLDNSQEHFGSFIWRRFMRLFPAYAVCLGLSVAISFSVIGWLESLPWHNSQRIREIIQNSQWTLDNFGANLGWHLTMLHGLIPHELLPNSTGAFLDVAWSVSLEWQFYLVAPFIFFLVKRNWGLAACLVGVWLSYRSIRYFGTWELTGRLATYRLHAFLPLKLHFFFIGVLSYFTYKFVHQFARTLPAVALPAVVLATIIFIDSYAIWIWVAVFGTLLVPQGTEGGWMARVISRVLNARIVQSVGRVSYSVYLLHMPVIFLATAVLLRWHKDWSQSGFLAWLTVLVAAIAGVGSYALYRWVEKPAIEFARAHAPTKRPNSSALRVV